MSQVLTLAELVAQAEAEDNPNAAATAEENQESEQEEDFEEEESTEEEESDNDDESDDDKESKDDKPEWAKTPDPKSFVPAKVHSELRKELRATKEADSALKAELDAARARLAELERGNERVAPQSIKAPTLADCDFDDEVFAQKSAEYTNALVEQKLRERESKGSQEAEQARLKASIDSEVDKHYERAAELVKKGTVSADNFKAADQVVRRAMSEAINGDGDFVIDYMIANLGEGSEAVMFHLGVNPAALSKLKETMNADKSGMRAMAYLGGLAAKFSAAPIVKPSNTPKPDKVLTGTAKISPDNARKAYIKAEKAGDISGMLAAERAANGKGIDTSKW